MIIDPYNWLLTPILKISLVAKNTVVIRVAKPDNYVFEPGQYSLVRAETSPGTSMIRQYSFSSTPNQPYLEFLIRLLPGGSVSTWFFTIAKQGDIVHITKPYGQFKLDPESKHHLLIAGGVGIAPFLSMIDTDQSDIDLIYSERSEDRIAIDTALAEQLGSRYHLHISGDHGRIDGDFMSDIIKPNQTYYLCGSKQFVDGIEKLLVEKNISASSIKREAFTLQ